MNEVNRRVKCRFLLKKTSKLRRDNYLDQVIVHKTFQNCCYSLVGYLRLQLWAQLFDWKVHLWAIACNVLLFCEKKNLTFWVAHRCIDTEREMVSHCDFQLWLDQIISPQKKIKSPSRFSVGIISTRKTKYEVTLLNL